MSERAKMRKQSSTPKLAATDIKQAIVIVRGMPVILAHDLARFFETTTKAVEKYNTYRPHYSIARITPVDYIQTTQNGG